MKLSLLALVALVSLWIVRAADPVPGASNASGRSSAEWIQPNRDPRP